MASPSPSDLARDAKAQADILRTEFELLRKELEKQELARLREQVAVLEDRVTKLERAKEESEKRHWQFVYISLGAAFALLSTVLVQLGLAFLKK